MKTFHFFENNKEVLHRLQETNYVIGDFVRIKGRNGKVISTQTLNLSNIRINLILEPKKPTFIPVDPKKLRRR